MSAICNEVALDLSSRRKSESSSKAVSPAPSLSSEHESYGGGDRPNSALSDNDSFSLKASYLKSSAYPSHPLQMAASMPESESLSPSLPSNMRPFKMYPFEPLPGMYTQVPQHSPASLYPYADASALGGVNLYDSAISLTSPIGKYLQQRKRRHERQTENVQNPRSNSPSTIEESQAKDSSDSNEPPAKKAKETTEEGGEENYWDRRRKNNEAAKRSRDARRAKEEEIALRAAILEQENLKLRAQVSLLKTETAKLHYMLYNRI